MTVTAFRLQNFMGFEDTRWIELRPITLLFGRNSSGKSALLRALYTAVSAVCNGSTTSASGGNNGMGIVGSGWSSCPGQASKCAA